MNDTKIPVTTNVTLEVQGGKLQVKDTLPEQPAPTRIYKCQQCGYVGKGITLAYPVLTGQPDTRGEYCPRCLQAWYYRNIGRMKEVK